MPTTLPRRTAISFLLLVGVCLGSNHVAARLAFDHGTGLVTALLMRSGVMALAMAGVVLWQRARAHQALRPPPGSVRWLLALGALIALQSLLLYSAVAHIPVALALLAFNIYPVLYVLLSWALGGRRPGAAAGGLMALILFGLALALDAPGRLRDAGTGSAAFWAGAGLAVVAAIAFACAMWLIDHRVKAVAGAVRSLATISLVFVLLAAAGASGLLPGGLHWPQGAAGWAGLALLTLLYGSASSALFILMPRLDMARNAPACNIEPIAALVLGWLVLGQALSPLQVAGALLVVAGIVLLARTGGR